MALIPSDVGVRLRLETEAQLLQPTRPVGEIPGDLPELRPGQQFAARIQEALPDNTYRALVAGKSLTLALPEGAKAGDTLELVVVDRSSKLVVAQLANRAPTAESQSPYPYATLSRTAQLIGTLLPDEGKAAAPAPLNRGVALLNQPPQGSASLAPALALAVKQSGVFYEAHQVQWATGRLPLETLLQEPQGRLSNPQPQANDAIARAIRDFAESAGLAAKRPAEGEATTTREASTTQTNARTQPIPEEIRPVVQQQLDAVATQRLAWHGELWPGQTMEWEIEWDERSAATTEDGNDQWITSLRLTTPRLGTVEARLQLDGDRLRVAVLAADVHSAAEMRTEAPALEAALLSAGIQLQGIMIRADEVADQP